VSFEGLAVFSMIPYQRMIFVEQMNTSAMCINTIFVSELFTENASRKKIDWRSWHVIHVGQGEFMLLSIAIRDS
jgi:hypothetical protein